MPAFLLEIGLEEIPASMVVAAQQELAKRFEELVRRERLAADDFAVRSYSTPRRLAVVAEGLLPKQADVEETVVGPSTKVAYKDGAPTPAAIAFAKKSGVEVSALQTIQNAKGEYVAATVQRLGRSAAEALTSCVPAEIAAIHWPKNMYWRAGKPEKFVRPVRWLLALLDEEILPLGFAGVTADGVSYGHRVLHGAEPVVIRQPQEYVEKLRKAHVEVDPDARRHKIRKALDAAAREIPGARWREDEDLIEVVTHLTEWPSVILGSFDPLGLPKEVLITVMRDHQKYFALEDAEGNLLPHFLAVLNIKVDEAGAAIIRHGNERVLRARFNDARFFWDVDQKIPLVDRVEMLKNVTFQKDLGSYFTKTEENIRVAGRLQARMGTNSHTAQWAAHVAKADLTTEMVKEFPELQGIVGGLYIREQGLRDRDNYPVDTQIANEIANAVYEHYRPVSVSDCIPATVTACIVAMADKLVTIVKTFELGLQPTGSKDPLALRRAGNGIVRILIENEEIGTKLNLLNLVFASLEQVDDDNSRAVYEFLLDRFEYYLQEFLKMRLQVARAVRNSRVVGMDALLDTSQNKIGELIGSDYGFARVVGFARALNDQAGSPEVLAVAELLKRAANIQRQAREKGIEFSGEEKAALLQERSEKELALRVTAVDEDIQRNYRAGNYSEVIHAIAGLQQPLNVFFDSVMVMVDNAELRANRLALLARTESVVRWAADFSELASI